MSAPEPRVEIDLCGVMRIQKARRGVGWNVGEPWSRLRHGRPAIELVRQTHHADPVTAVVQGLLRAQAYIRARNPGHESLGLLAAMAAPDGTVTRGALEAAAATVQARREALGLSRPALAELAGLHRGTIWALEEGRSSPTFDTLAGVLGALDRVE